MPSPIWSKPVWSIAGLLALVLTTPLAAQAPQAQEAGTTAAANPAVEGTPPAAAARLLQVGVKVFERERVISQPDGQAQLLFRDGSSFTVGPNSNFVIDDFIFDPQSGSGKMAMSLSKGVFRFVGGKLSKDGAVALTTPSAVLGVRGGIALIEIGDTGATTATLVYGNELSVTNGGETTRVTRPGFAVTVPDARTPPGPPVRVGPGELARGVAPLRGQPGRAGGLGQQPPPPVVGAALRAPVALGPGPGGTVAGPGPGPTGTGQPQPQQRTGAMLQTGPTPIATSPFVGAPPPLKPNVDVARPAVGPRPPPPPPPRQVVAGAQARAPDRMRPPPMMPPPPPPPPP